MRQARLSRLRGMGRGGLSGIKFTKPTGQGHTVPLGNRPDLYPEELNDLWRKLGRTQDDLRLAKRVLKLKLQYPAGTIPELIAMDFLLQEKARFVFQQDFAGGRAALGGLVVDFFIDKGGSGLVWMIQGEYFHSQFPQVQKDAAAKAILLGSYINGRQIKRVVEIWENKIYENRPEVFKFGFEGIEIGR